METVSCITGDWCVFFFYPEAISVFRPKANMGIISLLYIKLFFIRGIDILIKNVHQIPDPIAME